MVRRDVMTQDDFHWYISRFGNVHLLLSRLDLASSIFFLGARMLLMNSLKSLNVDSMQCV